MSGRKVDINKAGVDDLSSLIGVGRAKAEAIVDARKARGGFKTISDLKDVPGIGPSILEQNHGMLSCSRVNTKSKQDREILLNGQTNPSDTYCLRRDRGGDAVVSQSDTTSSSYSLRERVSDGGGPSCSSEGMTYSLRDRGGGSGDTSKSRHIAPSTSHSPGASSFKEYRASTRDVGVDTSDDDNNNDEGEEDSPLETDNVNDEDDEVVDSEIEFKGRPSRQFELLSESESNSSHELECDENQEQGEEIEPPTVEVVKNISAKASVPVSNGDSQGEVKDDGDREDTTIGVVASLRSRSSVSTLDKTVMKRKSEGGGSKDGSPEKKPCRTSGETAVPTPVEVSAITPPASRSTIGSKSTDKSLMSHPLLRKGRIPSKAHPPPELAHWLKIFQEWSHPERLMALDELMELCEPTQVRHVMAVIEPQFQRDFISLLPKELALYVLTYLEPKDLCRAAQTCRYWRILAEDNLLWREKCKEESIDENLVYENRARKRSGCNSKSPWKTMYMRQKQIEYNWKQGQILSPKVLKGHDDHVITCLEFSGTKIVSGSDDNTLKVWSAITGKCLRTLVGHTGGVWSSQMRDSIIISGSTDRTLKVWNADTGQCVHTLYGHTSTVRCMCLYENKVVSGSRDATLRLWDVDTGQCLHVLMGHVAAVRCVQFDGRRVISGAYDYMVKVWDPETETCLHTLQGHTNRVYSLQFDGNHIVSGSLDTSIRVWDVETGQCLHTLIGHQSLTSGMELKDNILVSGNADSTVKVWDIKTGQCLQTLQGPNKHQSAVTCLQFSKKFVITSSDDGTVKVWSLKTGEFLRNLVALDSGGSGGVVWRIRCSNTKLVCAVGSRNGTEETKLLVLDFDVETDSGNVNSNTVVNGSPTSSLASALGRRASVTLS